MRFGTVSAGCSGARIVTGACSSVTRSRESCSWNGASHPSRRPSRVLYCATTVPPASTYANRPGRRSARSVLTLKARMPMTTASRPRSRAGVRQVADVAAARRQLERDRVGARRGLQELQRQVIVAHLDALLVEALAVD